METLKLNKDTARKLYPKAAPEFRQMLEETFGKDHLNQKITDRVKSFEDALELVGCSDNLKILLQYNGIDKEMIAAKAFAKLSIIVRALNEGWQPDWNNSSEKKYTPWFRMGSSSASGFSFVDCDFGNAGTGVAARLCFKSEELARYAGTQFVDIYRDYMTI